MKKNVLRVAQAVLILAVGFSACKKDELTNRESEAIRLTNTVPDSLNKDVEYTVNLVDASTANFVNKTAADFSGATITASQGGNVSTMTAGADGMVVFQGMQKGAMSVNIQMDGFATVDYTVAVASGYQGNLIPMIPVTGESNATISGTVYIQSDLTNATKETANTVDIFAIPQVGASDLGAAINAAGFTAFAYDGLSMSTTTDASGAYSLEVPAAADAIEYRLTVSHFQTNQSIVMETLNGADVTGIQTIPTNYGSGISTAMASDIPNLPGAYVTISAPDFAVEQAAVVTAEIDNPNGIAAYVLDENGQGYNLPGGSGFYYMDLDVDGNGTTDADANVGVYIDNGVGRVVYSDINSEGEGYTATTTENVAFEQVAFDGDISFINTTTDVAFVTINEGGEFLMDLEDADGSLNFTLKVDGQVISAGDLTVNYGSQNNAHTVTYVEIDNASSYSFIVADAVTISLVTTGLTVASGSTELTTGFVSAVAFTTIGKGYAPNDTYTLLIEGGGGTGATAEAYTDADGIMYSGWVTDGGSGYTSAPTVTVLVDATAAGTQAEASVTVNADGTISGITIDNAGAGYTTTPTVTIASHLSTGSGATATAIVSGGSITGFTVTNVGSGYAEDANDPTTKAGAADFESAEVTAGGNVILDIDLGTGKRTIEN